MAPLVPELAVLQCELEGRTAEALVEVREERDPPPPPLPPPVTLEFERPRYRVGWTRVKNLLLRAPSDVVPPGSALNVSSNAPGVAVLTSHPTMQFDRGLGYVTGEVRVEGRALGSEATITASIHELSARCRAVVTRDEEGPALKFKIVDEDKGRYRALWEDHEDPSTGEHTQVLEIQGRHPALRRYLGPGPEFPRQNSEVVRALIAEIVADNVCRLVARRVDVLRHQSERPDAEGFYAEHYGLLLKLLPRLHELLLP